MKQDNYILLKGPAVKPHFKQKKKCHKQLRSIVFPLHSQKGDDKFFMTNLPDEVQGNFVQIKMSKCLNVKFGKQTKVSRNYFLNV